MPILSWRPRLSKLAARVFALISLHHTQKLPIPECSITVIHVSGRLKHEMAEMFQCAAKCQSWCWKISQQRARIGCKSEGFDWSIPMFGLLLGLWHEPPPFTQITGTRGSLICTQNTHTGNNQLSPFTWFLQLQARILLSHLSTHSLHFLAC